jgi:hypothetical protein
MPVDLLSRYRNLPVIEVDDARRGTTRALPVRRPPTSPAVGGRQHRFTDYQPLDLLARQHYNHEKLYWALLEYNGLNLPEDLATGEVIRIPPLNVITRVSRSG